MREDHMRKPPPISKPIDLTGRQFGRLTAIKLQYVTLSSGRRIVAWQCRCLCGRTKVILGMHLASGATTSCGCYNSEVASIRTKTHGGSGTLLHGIWKAMIRRCYNRNVRGFKHYGERGITVCDRWRFGEDGQSGFACFRKDMGERPADKSLDRINNEGSYEPSNCRWATGHEQRVNSRPKRKRC